LVTIRLNRIKLMERGNRARRIEKANRLAEERHLNRGVIVENEFSHNGMAPFMDVHKDGTFSDADKEPVEDEVAVNEDVVNEIDMDIINAAGDWITGGGMVSVGGESVPRNLATLAMSIMPAAAAAGFVATFWSEIKAKVGGKGDIEELSPAAKDAEKSRPPRQQHNERPSKPKEDRANNSSKERR